MADGDGGATGSTPTPTPSSTDARARLDEVIQRANDPDDPFDRAAAVAATTPADVESILHPQLVEGSGGPAGSAGSDGSPASAAPLTTGLGASPGAAVGAVVLDADAAADAGAEGESVILVMTETTPADVHGMAEAAGILTSKGGLASHAAVVARGWGVPAVVGAEDLAINETGFRVGDVAVNVGDTIAIDGSSGAVMVGAQELAGAETPDALEELLGWADSIAGGATAVRANADNAADAQVARDFGAQGIGLCRTEHQFLGERLAVIRRAILADDAAAEATALEELGTQQQQDFIELFEVMDGLPVTVRLLDPPLHEFLPDIEALAAGEARGELSEFEEKELRAARQWAEHNPMLGTRGVRLAVVRPELYRMQIRSLLAAMALRMKAGGDPILEIMVPLVVSPTELAVVQGWLTEIAEAEGMNLDRVSLGVMVETPRAALVAEDLALGADFLSFGTNDLTQMVFGFSRDDIEARLMRSYIEAGLLSKNPFQHLDIEGVGDLVRQAVSAARWAEPEMKIGVCGEHGGDPQSIEFFCALGFNYVSCSPFRVPIARLAAAHAQSRL